MRRSTSIALPILLGALLGVGGTFAARPHLPASPTVQGLRVAGERIPDETDPRLWLEQRDQLLKARPVELRHGELRFETTFGELGIGLDLEATLAEVQAVGHQGSAVRRLSQARAARRGEIDVAYRYTVDHHIARAHLARYASALAREPVNAEIDLEGHRKIPDVPGQELDVDATLAALVEGAGGESPLPLVSRLVDAEVTLHDLGDIDVSKVLASFETKYQTFKVGRSHNVELAAKRLNGLVLRPRQTVSFNDRVGPRSLEAGFQQAPEIVGDELTVGIGGGTCQVSTTLFGAALHGGLAVVERRSHSRPSGYTQLGLDATVAYGKVDLRLQNPHSFPIVVHAFTPQPGIIKVELLGGTAVKQVSYRYGIGRVEDYVRRITVKPWLKSGKSFRKQKGTRGMDVHSHVTIVFEDGRVEERQYYSGYRATPEVFWVAPDYDEGELPPLPAHAKGVEGRLAEDGSDVYPTAG
ncbi:MAG: VanW family protein [Polyangiaceae bacterium]